MIGISLSIRGPGSDVLLFSSIVEYHVFVYTIYNLRLQFKFI